MIQDARRRQQRQRRIAAASMVAGLAIAGLIVGFAGGGGGGGSGLGRQRDHGGSNPSAAAQVSSRVVAKVIPATHLCYPASARVQPYPHVVAVDYAALDIPCGRQAPTGYKFLGGSTPETVIALVNITFKARLGVNNRHTVYEFFDARASGPTSCTLNTGGSVGTSQLPIHAGRTVMLQDSPVCPGTYVGIISYQPHGAPGRDTLHQLGPVRDGSIIVGRFRYVVR